MIVKEKEFEGFFRKREEVQPKFSERLAVSCFLRRFLLAKKKKKSPKRSLQANAPGDHPLLNMTNLGSFPQMPRGDSRLL